MIKAFDVTLAAKSLKNIVQRITYEIHGLEHDEAVEHALKISGDEYYHLYTIAALRRKSNEC